MYLLSWYIARTLTDGIQEPCTEMTGTFQLGAHRRSIINPTTWIPTAVIAPSYRTKCSHLCTCHNVLKFRMRCLTSIFLVRLSSSEKNRSYWLWTTKKVGYMLHDNWSVTGRHDRYLELTNKVHDETNGREVTILSQSQAVNVNFWPSTHK